MVVHIHYNYTKLKKDDDKMTKKILNNSAIFKCQKGIAVTFAPIKYQGLAKENGKFFLNAESKCNLVSVGQCTLQPNPTGAGFLPCNQMQIPVTSWNGTDNIIKIRGGKALLDNSSTMCPLGGKICLQSIGNTVFKAGCAATITEIVVDKVRNESGNRNVRAGSENLDMPEKTEGSSMGNDNSKNIKEDTNEIEEIPNAKYAKCPYEKCKNRKYCEYFNAKAEIDNNSNKLRRNFIRERNNEYEAYTKQYEDALEEYSEYSWGDAAHHIISGNQIFMARIENGDLRYGHLLMLANMCDYDINNAWNCILLPSLDKTDDSKGELQQFEKKANAFEIMDIMKKQWHLGTHDYTIPKDSLKYYNPSKAQVLSSGIDVYFPNYATAVKAVLDNLNVRYSRKCCWKKKNNEEFKQKFIAAFNEISGEVGKKLCDFSKQPKASYPFFVSKVSVDYAYGAPKTGKVILIYKKGNDIFASKFRISRKQKDDYKIKIVQNQEIPELKVDDEHLLEFVRYCDNTILFWIDNDIDTMLPWKYDKDKIEKRNIDGENIEKFAIQNATELFAFMDTNEVTNIGQSGLIRKRWKEVKENGFICD